MTTGKLWKRLALGVGFCVSAGAHTANAQTVWVRNATPGATAELMVNADKVATGTADASGLVSLTATPARPTGKETDAHLYVDTCGNLRRVLLVDVGAAVPPPDSSCHRTDVPDLFSTTSATTFVVDANDSMSIRVRQGPAFDEWIHPVLDEQGNLKTTRTLLPRGLMLTGGATGVQFSNVVSVSCGDAPTCSGVVTRVGATAGATYWITRFLAVEGTYTKPQDVHTSGSGTNYTFTGVFQTRSIVTVDGKLGFQLGPTRIYGMAGGDYTTAIASTTQIVVSSAAGQGGTETFGLETKGWGLTLGGGIEGWFGDRFALYAEGGRAALNGAAINHGDGSLSDNITFATLGVRFRLGL